MWRCSAGSIETDRVLKDTFCTARPVIAVPLSVAIWSVDTSSSKLSVLAEMLDEGRSHRQVSGRVAAGPRTEEEDRKCALRPWPTAR